MRCPTLTLDIDERRVGIHDALLAQVLESHEVPALAEPVQPAPAEGEGAEVLVDRIEQRLGLLQPQRHVAHVEVLHVVAALHVLVHVPLGK